MSGLIRGSTSFTFLQYFLAEATSFATAKYAILYNGMVLECFLLLLCVSLTADGPQRTNRLSISLTAILPSCLWSLRISPSLPGSRPTTFLSQCKFSTVAA